MGTAAREGFVEQGDAEAGQESARIGRRLREARQALGLTQEQAGNRLGLHPNTYHKWESGERVRSWTRVLAACEAFDTTPNELLGFEATHKLDKAITDALDAEELGLLLESTAELAISRVTPEQPSGGDATFWRSMGVAFAEVIAMTLRREGTSETRGFLRGYGFRLRD